MASAESASYPASAAVRIWHGRLPFSYDKEAQTLTGGMKTGTGKDRVIPLHPKMEVSKMKNRLKALFQAAFLWWPMLGLNQCLLHAKEEKYVL